MASLSQALWRRPRKSDETPVHPSSLVRAFLAEDVVCSVVEPSAETAPTSLGMALRGARIADLLILDWLLFGNASATMETPSGRSPSRTSPVSE